ncbi:MAG: PAS domain-containing protein [Rhodospirillales bacterium]|nr:PAS domain-containing protein [Rhodospirillales bacterium]
MTALGWIAPAVALGGIAVMAASTSVLLYPLARNLQDLGRWLMDHEASNTPEPPSFMPGPASHALGVLASGTHDIMRVRDERIDHLTAETGRMLDTLPDPLLLMARDRRIVRLNRAARSLFGERAIGRDLSRVLRDPALDGAVDRVLGGDAGSSIEVTLQAGRVERLFAVDVAPLPVGANGGPAVMAMFHDITAIRRTEQMRVDFVANASHEIRSPLATLIGCIETLRGPAREDAEATERFLEMMDDQGRRMARLVGDLLTLSRIELKEHTRPTGHVDLAGLLERLQTSLQFDADEKDMAVILNVETGLPDIRGDEGELEQVIYNLVSNAIKYGRRGTDVEVTAGRPTRLPDDLRIARGPLVRVAVRDRGDGIETHHIPRLTERFYRIDTARSREMGGTGLGLAIVKHVLNRHRGALHIESRVSEGSTFTVWLPGRAD